MKEISRNLAEFLRLATRRSVVRRALFYAVFVGTILVLINHGDRLIEGSVDLELVLKGFFTALVPYCVSTASSIGAIRQGEDAEKRT